MHEKFRTSRKFIRNQPKMASCRAGPFLLEEKRGEKRILCEGFRTRIISLFKTHDEHQRRMSIIQCVAAVSV